MMNTVTKLPTAAEIEQVKSLNLTGLDQFLTFILGSETYGIDILRVQEIKGWEEPTSLPNMPDYIKGVINLRGAIIPIVDLRQRFLLSNITYDHTTVVIIVQVQQGDSGVRAVGIVVDGVSDVHDIDLNSLQPAPKVSETKIDGAYIKGLATLGNKMVILLSVDELVNMGLFA